MILALALLSSIAAQPAPALTECTIANAVEASIPVIHRDASRYLDRCIVVEGPASWQRLYGSRQGIYLALRARGGHLNAPPGSWHRLGLYGHDDEMSRRLRLLQERPATHIVAVGRVDTCERIRQRAISNPVPESTIVIPSLGGYCHWASGPVLSVTFVSVDPGVRYERLVGDRHRSEYGNLRRLPDDWPWQSQLQSFANEFLSALRGGDRVRLTALFSDQLPHRQRGIDARITSYLLDDPSSPFTQVRRAQSLQTAIFVYTRPQSFEVDEGDAPEGIVCFCRGEDCSNRWPISEFDANNGAERPYACVRVEPRDWLPRRAGLALPTARSWLLEPESTSFRASS